MFDGEWGMLQKVYSLLATKSDFDLFFWISQKENKDLEHCKTKVKQTLETFGASHTDITVQMKCSWI